MYINETLNKYKDTYLYRKRSSSHGFAENLQTYSDAVEHFSNGSRSFLSDHRDYVSGRDILVTPYKRPSQQRLSKPQVIEIRDLGQTIQIIKEVQQSSNRNKKIELRLENVIEIPPQKVEHHINNIYYQPVSRTPHQETSNIIIGDTGEEAVADYERDLLRRIGQAELAGRVEIVSKTIGDGLGYDVLSFDQYGNKKFIEVKTTRSNALTDNFTFTKGELKFLIKNPDTAFVYCVFGITKNSPRVKIYPAGLFSGKTFETVEYRASVR